MSGQSAGSIREAEVLTPSGSISAVWVHHSPSGFCALAP